MGDSHKIHALRAEVARLRQEQLAATDGATYLGWTRAERAAYNERADRIEGLLRTLARLDPTSSFDV